METTQSTGVERKPSPKRLDLSGRRFGRLLVEGWSDRRNRFRPLWKCHCDCGSEFYTESSSLVSNRVLSCGCLKREVNRQPKTHGQSRTPLHAIWLSMKNRCGNPNDEAYANYGGRGITVCERWKLFENFMSDMGPRPEGMELDRRDNDLGYNPENCRWITKSGNLRNTRRNRLITYNDQTHCIAEWAEITGIPPKILSDRVRRGWSVDRLFTKQHRST